MKKIFVCSTMILASACSNSSVDKSIVGNCATGDICTTEATDGQVQVTVPEEAFGTYATVYASTSSESPFKDDTKATFEITEGNTLVVTLEDNECYIIENPVASEGTEGNFLFKDTCNNNVTFNLSLNNSDDSFNEVNVQPVDEIGFFGQFTEDEEELEE